MCCKGGREELEMESVIAFFGSCNQAHFVERPRTAPLKYHSLVAQDAEG